MGSSEESLRKVNWADSHLDALNKSIQAFIDTKPYSFRVQPKSDPSCNAILAKSKPSPTEWGLLIGDIAHNARGALDYIVDRLSGLAPDDQQRNRIGFPLCRDPAEFQNRRGSLLKGVDPLRWDEFLPFQPYQGSGGNIPLGILRDINNHDKHRSIRVVSALGRFTSYVFTTYTPGPDSAVPPVRYRGNIQFGNSWSVRHVGDGVVGEDETEVAEITRLSPTAPDVHVYPNVRPEIQFAVGQFGVERRAVLPTLRLILDRVKEVVGHFP